MANVILDGITKRFGAVTAVDNVSLEISHGEFLFLLGPSGCGKTTLLRTIAGFAKPDAGRIFFGDRDSTYLHPSKRNIGMVFQNYALFPHMTVFDNVEFGLKVRSVPPADRRERVMNALEMVKLGDLRDRYPSQLSGGQQQRAALARAIVIDPDILLLDEPFGALDRNLRANMQLELKLLQKELQITTIFVTHDQEEALTMSDRIAVMRAGQFEQIDAPLHLYERPDSEFVANFIGAVNFLKGEVTSMDDGVADVRTSAGLDIRIPAVTPVEPQHKLNLVVRPEKIVLNDTRLPQYDNIFSGRIENMLYLGDKTHYYVAVADTTMLVFEQNLTADPGLYSAGQQVFIHFDSRAVVALPELSS